MRSPRPGRHEAADGVADLSRAMRDGLRTAGDPARADSAADERRRAYALAAEGGRVRDEGDWETAEQFFRESLLAFGLLEDSVAIGGILTSLAELHIADGDIQTGTELARQAVERRPGDVDALTVLGHARWLSGSPADAQVTFDQALRRDRTAVRALAGRGQVRTELRDYRKGLADLDRALEAGVAADDEADVRSARALALAGLGRFNEAHREIELALDLAPDRAQTVLRAGRMAVLEGRFEEVREDLKRIADHASPVADAARELLARQEDAGG